MTHYQQALEAATREYQELQAKRQEIDDRLAQLAQTIGTLNRLCGFESTVQWGLTDACRIVLKAARRAMTPTEVRDRLEAIGFDLTKYTNSLAAIHTVLRRLHEIAVATGGVLHAVSIETALLAHGAGRARAGQVRHAWRSRLDAAL